MGAGKDFRIYVVNREGMGKYNRDSNHIYQELQAALSGQVLSTPAYFNNTVYYRANITDTLANAGQYVNSPS